jgi:hypothetical protein
MNTNETKTFDTWRDVYGRQATTQDIIDGFNASEYSTLTEYLEWWNGEIWGADAGAYDFAKLARQIKGELYQELEAEAREAVEAAAQEPGVWFGRQNAEQVVFGSGVYTTANNGDGTDYEDADAAAAALANEWLRDELKQR